jgi:putative oxidoreductase
MAIFGKLGRYTNTGLLIMRVGVGVMMIIHGLPKISGGPAKWEQLGHAMGNLHVHFAPTFWGFMSAITEAVGGLFMVLGLWFRLVSLLLLFNMIVACTALFASGKGIAESTEALELTFVFAGLIFLGPGIYSVDKS